MNQTHYTIHGINGPVVKVTGGKGLAMMDMVSVGEEGLIGEVVSVDRSATTVQVYEDTAGLKPGDVIIKCDGQTIETLDELNEIRDQHQVGDTLTLTIVRNGAKSDISITLGEDRTGAATPTPARQ